MATTCSSKDNNQQVSCDSTLFKSFKPVSSFHFFRDGANELLVKKFYDTISKLDFYEKISMVFLLVDNVKTGLEMLNKMELDSSYDPVSVWCRSLFEQYDKDWEILLLESLTLIQNYKIINELGCSKYDMLNIFRPNTHYKTFLLNPVKKLLFRLCETLTIDEAESLIDSMEEDPAKVLSSKIIYSTKFLEVFFLRWSSLGHINIENTIDITVLIANLKEINVEKARQLETGAQEILNSMKSNSKAKVVEASNNVAEQWNENCYRIIDPKNVGLCIIVNEQDFSASRTSLGATTFPDRNGSEVDCKELKKVMSELCFKVVTLNNLFADKIISSIADEIAKNFDKEVHSVMMLVILSHGNEGNVYGVDGAYTPIRRISSSLNIPSILGKPKVVIIQACQGNKFYQSPNDPALASDGIFPDGISPDGISSDDITSGVGDLLVCVATVPGFKAFRHKENGSWYIQAVCKQLREHPEQDIYTVITSVNKELSKQEVRVHNKMVTMRSEFTSCFSNSLYLKVRENKK